MPVVFGLRGLKCKPQSSRANPRPTDFDLESQTDKLAGALQFIRDEQAEKDVEKHERYMRENPVLPLHPDAYSSRNARQSRAGCYWMHA
jgi:hypothetical protein